MQTSRIHPADADRPHAGQSTRPATAASGALSLRPLLIADAASCLALGAMLVPFGRPLAGITGLPSTLLLDAGLALLAFGTVLGWAARRPDVPTRFGRIAAACNASWVAASVAVLLAQIQTITVVGEVLLVGQAVAVGALAWLEWRSVRGR